jgi:hypothetical protein
MSTAQVGPATVLGMCKALCVLPVPTPTDSTATGTASAASNERLQELPQPASSAPMPRQPTTTMHARYVAEVLQLTQAASRWLSGVPA